MIKTFFSGLFGGASFKAIGIIAAVAFGIGFGAGFGTRDVFADLAAERVEAKARAAEIRGLNSQIENLRKFINVRDAATAADAKRAADVAAQLAKLKEKADAAISQATDAVCLDGDDLERLRDLWDAPASGSGAVPGNSR